MQEVACETVLPTEKAKSEVFCLFIPGGLATHEGVASIDQMLKQRYGKENVLVPNSVFSFERPNPQRFTQMAKELSKAMKEGKSVDVYTHSGGGVELVRVIKEWQRIAPKFFEQETIDNLKIVLISPAGFFKGISGAADFLKRLGKFAYFDFISKKNVFRGLTSLLLVPPKDINSEELYGQLRKALPEISLYQTGLETINPPHGIDYQPYLTKEEATQLKALDEKINQLLETGSLKELKKYLGQRGKMLARVQLKAFAGEYFDQTGYQELPKIGVAETAKLYGQALLGMPSLFKDVLLGKTLETVQFLSKKGVKTEFLVPEYDIILPFRNVREFFGEKPLNATLLAGYTHAALALDPVKKNKNGSV